MSSLRGAGARHPAYASNRDGLAEPPVAVASGPVGGGRPRLPHPLDPFQRLSAKSEVLNQLLERRASRLRQEQEQRVQQQQQQQVTAVQVPGPRDTLPPTTGANGAPINGTAANGAAANGAATNGALAPPPFPSSSPAATNGSVPGLAALTLPPAADASLDLPPGTAGAPGGQRRTTKVRFWLKFRAEWGQRIKVVGTDQALGHWQLAHAPELRWSEGDNWHSMVELPSGGCWLSSLPSCLPCSLLSPAAWRSCGRGGSTASLPAVQLGCRHDQHSTRSSLERYSPHQQRGRWETPQPALGPVLRRAGFTLRRCCCCLQAECVSTSMSCWTTQATMPWPGSTATTPYLPCAAPTTSSKCLTTGGWPNPVGWQPRV